MTRRLLLVLALSLSAGWTLADTKPDLSPRDKAVGVLVQALNDSSAKALHALCDKGVQDRLPVGQMDLVLRQPLQGAQAGAPDTEAVYPIGQLGIHCRAARVAAGGHQQTSGGIASGQLSGDPRDTPSDRREIVTEEELSLVVAGIHAHAMWFLPVSALEGSLHEFPNA